MAENITYCQSAFSNYTNIYGVFSHMEFNGCLQETILHWIPPSILIILGIFEISYYFSKQNVNRNIPCTKLNVSKLICISVLIIIHLSQIGIFLRGIITDTQSTVKNETTFIGQQIIFTSSYLISLLLLLLSLKYGIRTSPTQFIFYLVSVICGASNFESVIQNSSLILGLFSAHFVLLFILFILNFFVDIEPRVWNEKHKVLENPTPQLTASFASKLCYAWAMPLMWKGYKNPLEPSCLWSVDPSLTSRGSVPIFDKYYEAPTNQSKNCYVKVPTTVEPMSIEEAKDEVIPNATAKQTKPSSILGPLVKAFGGQFLFGSFLHLIHVVMTMVPSQIMKMLISHVEEHGELGDNDLQYNWRGYFYAGLLFGITVFQSLIAGQYYEILYRVGMRVRTVLISTIYRKSLRLANEAKKDITTGEIVNLMSIDVQRFMVSIIQRYLRLPHK